MNEGYARSVWPGEDRGPLRVASAPDECGLLDAPSHRVISRMAIASTMVIFGDDDTPYLLCHTGGDAAVSWVEALDPATLEPTRRSVDLPGGKTWPGGIAAHANGDLYVVFGRYVHRLAADLSVRCARELERDRPYNSFVILPDGHLVTKDFGGAIPGEADDQHVGARLVVLEPDELTVVATLDAAEPSIARLSARDNEVYVVGTNSLMRAIWDGLTLSWDTNFAVGYRTSDGQGYGWDAVVADGAAWFLDNGKGANAYNGSFEGLGVATVPLSLHRIDLATGHHTHAQVTDRIGGLIANPPVIDTERRVAIGYDSANRVVTGFSIHDNDSLHQIWSIELGHAAHPLLDQHSGTVVLCDFDRARGTEDICIVDVSTGAIRTRYATQSPLQSTLFGCFGPAHDLYMCSFTHVTRICSLD